MKCFCENLESLANKYDNDAFRCYNMDETDKH